MSAQKIFYFGSQLEAENEELKTENEQLKVEKGKYEARIAQLETKLKASADAKPRYANNAGKRRINLYCFICTVAIILSSAYATGQKGTMAAVMELTLLTALIEIVGYAKYFFSCVNRRFSWDIAKGISATMDILAIILCVMNTTTGEMTYSYPVVMYFSFIIAKRHLPNLGKLFLSSSSTFDVSIDKLPGTCRKECVHHE